MQVMSSSHADSGIIPPAHGRCGRDTGWTFKSPKMRSPKKGRTLLDRLLYHVRLAVRSYIKTPGLTLTILLTLTLGIAASLASFSLVNALLMRPLGVAKPGELVRIAATGEGEELLRITSVMRESLGQLQAFAGVCGVTNPASVVTFQDHVTTQPLLVVSGECFDTLGVKALFGRVLTPDDERGRNPVVVATYTFWQRELAAAPDALGRTIEIDGQPFTVVGVTQPEFRGLSNAFPSSLVVPATAVGRVARDFYWCDVVARLANGISLQQARAQVDAAWPRLKETAGLTAKTPAAARQRLEASRAFVGDVSTGMENVLRPTFQQPLLVTFGLAMLMLGICGANVANLLAARALARRREYAMRLALGASSSDMWWQSVIEAIIPVLAAAALAVPLAQGISLALLDVLRSSYLDLELPLAWDGRVAMFLGGTVAAVTLVACLVDVVSRRGSRSLSDAVRASGRTTNRSGRSRRVLVAAQIALTVMLVGSAATFVRTLQQYYAVDPGFSVESGLVAPLTPLPGGYARPPGVAYYEEMLRRVEAIPGVKAASLTTWMPLGAPSRGESVERVPHAGGSTASAVTWSVSDRFFEAGGIQLRAGQTFTRNSPTAASPVPTADQSGADRIGRRTAILSESLAKRLFPDGNATGGQVRLGQDPETQNLRVVGVAADARLAKPQDGQPSVIYLNYWEDPRVQRWPYLLVRSIDDRPESLSRAVTDAVRAGGREFPLWTRAVSAQWNVALVRERLLAGTSAIFGLIGLVIAAVGLFAVLSHAVTSRRAEIGIRMAIGAAAPDITRLLIREVAGLLVVGCAAGAVTLVLTSRAFGSRLFGVAAGDPWLLAVTFGFIGLIALLALWLPLRRALAIDPLTALRAE